MAFNKDRLDVLYGSRGVGSLMVYNAPAGSDNLAAIKAANFFNDNDVRAVIRANRQGTAAGTGVPAHIIGTDGQEIVLLRLADDGNVTVNTTAAQIIT